jgi:hypothetical protein
MLAEMVPAAKLIIIEMKCDEYRLKTQYPQR